MDTHSNFNNSVVIYEKTHKPLSLGIDYIHIEGKQKHEQAKQNKIIF